MVQHTDGASANAKTRLLQSLDLDTATLLTYVGGVLFVFFTYEGLSDKDFSVVLTFGSLMQCLAFLQLSIKTFQVQKLDGISSGTLEVYAVALFARLCSTLYLNGYLPLDRTGDMLYQAGDVVSLVLVVRLLKLARGNVAYGAEPVASKEELVLDTRTAVVVSLIMAVAVHPNLDNWLPFDVAWATSLYLDSIAIVPQLVLLQKGGSLEALSVHYLLLMFLSRLMSGLFWFYGFYDVAPVAGGVNYAGWGVVVAHGIQLATLSYALLRCLHLKHKTLQDSSLAIAMNSLHEQA